MGATCVFGGSFDPPHWGHKAMVERVLSDCPVLRVLLAPLYVPWHKREPVASFSDRVRMLELTFSKDPRVEISRVDERLGGVTYTYKTLEELSRRECRGEDLYFLMGADSLEYFQEWTRWREILKMARPIVFARSGHSLNPPRDNTFLIVRDFDSPWSSSIIRRELQERGSSDGLLPSVLEYIKKRRLYGQRPKGED